MTMGYAKPTVDAWGTPSDTWTLELGFGNHIRRDTPLTIQELETLYAATDWRVVLFHPHIGNVYGTFPPVAMFKALALPYLINIQSEQALARELSEREPLRVLCGFVHGRTPTRAMFWHFRHTPPELYPDLMLRVLITLVLSGRKPNLNLPIVASVPLAEELPDVDLFVFRIDEYRPEIQVWISPVGIAAPAVETAGKTITELRDELRMIRNTRPKRGLSTELPLPAEVRTELPGKAFIQFVIDKPDWLRPYSGQRSRSIDILTTVGQSTETQYVACNIVVLRTAHNRRQVLLARRKAGYGAGQYALPGGKAKPDESLEKCTERELLEETDIAVVRSRPISIRRTRLPGQPPVVSVGALVDEFKGHPRNREPLQLSKWEWFDLDELPRPLFEPSRLALDDFVRGRFPSLEWSGVETQLQHFSVRPVQLELVLSKAD